MRSRPKPPYWYGRKAKGHWFDRGSWWLSRASLWHAWATGQVVPPRDFQLEPTRSDRWGAVLLLLLVAGAVSGLWWAALCR